MFENKANVLTETVPHGEQCPDAMRTGVFPHCAAQLQKCYLCGAVHKPRSVKTCEWLARMCEINDCLPKFPGSGMPPDLATGLDDNQIEEIAKCDIPCDHWQT